MNQTIVDQFFQPKKAELSARAKREFTSTLSKWNHMKYSVVYNFTLAPHAKSSLTCVLHGAAQLLRRNKAFQEALYVIEISSLGKPHIHGIIRTKDSCEFKKSVHPETYMQYNLGADNGWINYIFKNSPSVIYKIQT